MQTSREKVGQRLTRNFGASEEPLFSTPHLLVFAALWALVQIVILVTQVPEVLHGAQVDADGYMRLVRVKLLLEHGAWFDASIPRSNWPFGEVSHWTRPLDAIIIAISFPFRPFLNSDSAIAVAGALVSALCHLALCIAGVRVVQPIVPGPERFLAMPAMLMQPGPLGYGTAGRADHHALIFLLFALALGEWIRILIDPEKRKPAVLAGILSGLGIWVSPEALLPLAVIFASGGIAWILQGSSLITANRRFCSGLAAAVGVAILFERPPTSWLEATFDQISVAHLTMGLLALAFWWLAGSAETLRPLSKLRSITARTAVVTVGGVVSVGALAVLYPHFFRGPWADVDPAVISVWLRHVEELKPLWPRDIAGLGMFMSHLGPAFVVIPAAAWWLREEWTGQRRLVWVLLLLSLLVYVPLASAQRRFSPYAGVVCAILLVELLRRVFLQAAKLRTATLRSLARVGAVAGLVLAFRIVTLFDLAVSAITEDTSEPKQRSDSELGCSLTQMSLVLGDSTGLGRQPRTIAAFLDFGPEILYRTPHRVLAGPYHRNYQGILATHRLLTASDEREALRLIRERQVNFILLCPPLDRAYFRKAGPKTLYERLVTETPPDWIQRAELPATAPSGFQLFYVREMSGP